MWDIVTDAGPGRAATPLLTSVVGTAATLVAIIGGLLVARVASMAQNREAAKERLETAKRRVTTARDNVTRLEGVDIEMVRKAWLAKAVPALAEQPQIGRRRLEGRCGVWPHEWELLAPYVEQINRTIIAARADINSARGVNPLPHSWENFRIEHGLQQEDELEIAVYEEVYCDMWERQDAQRRQDETRALEKVLASADTADARVRIELQRRALRSPVPNGRVSRVNNLEPASAEERRTVSLSLGDAGARLDDAEEALRIAESAQRVNEVPPFTWPAVTVLAYLGVVDVGGPLALLACEPSDLGVGWRIVTVATLLLGVVGLAWTLIRNLRSERREPSKKDQSPQTANTPTANS